MNDQLEFELLTEHVIDDNHDPKVTVKVPGARYDISNFNTSENTSRDYPPYQFQTNNTSIIFHNGQPLYGLGANGVTMESLIAVCIHRLEHFQKGAYPSDENQEALGHLKASLDVLKRRTIKMQAMADA